MNLFTFLLAVLLLELTPGPNMAYLATLALSRGRAAGLIATAGVGFGLAVHATVAGLGAGVLIQRYRCFMKYCAGLGSDIFCIWRGRVGRPKGKFRRSAPILPSRQVHCSFAASSRTSLIRNLSYSSYRCFPPSSELGPALHHCRSRWPCLEASMSGSPPRCTGAS